MDPCRVLVVEDEPRVLALLLAVLGVAGHRVVEARTARDAERALARPAFDAVLVDVRVGDGDGLRLIEKLRDRTPSIPVVALGRDADDSTGAHAAGARAFVQVPFGARSFLNVLDGLLGRA